MNPPVAEANLFLGRVLSTVKKLVLALDVIDEVKALDIAESVSVYVDELKVNYPLVLSAGVGIIRKLSSIKPVIADFKVADVPHTAEMIAQLAFENGASAIIVHGFAGRDVVEAVNGVAKDYAARVYVVTELSNPGAAEFMSPVSLEVVEMAKSLGCAGLIAPATRLERLELIRRAAGDMEVLCPGIGAQGGSLEALKFCDGIIVGRSIYASKDPVEAAKELRRVLDEF